MAVEQTNETGHGGLALPVLPGRKVRRPASDPSRRVSVDAVLHDRLPDPSALDTMLESDESATDSDTRSDLEVGDGSAHADLSRPVVSETTNLEVLGQRGRVETVNPTLRDFLRVTRRMATDPATWDDWHRPTPVPATPRDTPVTPTVRTTSVGDRNASSSVGNDTKASTRPAVAERRRQVDLLLASARGLPLDDSRRIERELRASVLHHEVHSLLCGLEAVDHRTSEERAWERKWRSTPGRPAVASLDIDMAKVGRAVERSWQGVPDDVWRELY